MTPEKPDAKPDNLTHRVQVDPKVGPFVGKDLRTTIYDQLRGLAGHYMHGERFDHTLQPTALVNEAWLRLVDQRNANPEDQTTFLAIAANTMRRILVDHARAHKAEKRGGGKSVQVLDTTGIVDDKNAETAVDILALHHALSRLQENNERQADIVELKFFGGLSNEQVAQHLGVSLRTVEADWSMARAWLHREISEPPQHPE